MSDPVSKSISLINYISESLMNVIYIKDTNLFLDTRSKDKFSILDDNDGFILIDYNGVAFILYVKDVTSISEELQIRPMDKVFIKPADWSVDRPDDFTGKAVVLNIADTYDDMISTFPKGEFKLFKIANNLNS